MVNLERRNQQNSTSSNSCNSTSSNSFSPENLLQEFEFQIMNQDAVTKTLFKSKANP